MGRSACTGRPSTTTVLPGPSNEVQTSPSAPRRYVCSAARSASEPCGTGLAGPQRFGGGDRGAAFETVATRGRFARASSKRSLECCIQSGGSGGGALHFAAGCICEDDAINANFPRDSGALQRPRNTGRRAPRK
jgi:hypothetical protein